MSAATSKISVAIGIGSALVLHAPQSMSSGKKISVDVTYVSNSPTTNWNPSDTRSSSLEFGPVVHRTWGAEANLRFKELARKDVMDQLSAQEWAELDSLSALRRDAKFPLTADQILWQRKQKAATQKLLAALKEYVEIHDFES